MDPLDIPPDLLRIDPARMRELGYWVVDRVIEHLETLEEQPALVVARQPQTGERDRVVESPADAVELELRRHRPISVATCAPALRSSAE